MSFRQNPLDPNNSQLAEHHTFVPNTEASAAFSVQAQQVGLEIAHRMQLLLDVIQQRAPSIASSAQELISFRTAWMNLRITLAGIIQLLSQPQNPTLLQSTLSSLMNGALVLQNTVTAEEWHAICTDDISQSLPRLPIHTDGTEHAMTLSTVRPPTMAMTHSHSSSQSNQSSLRFRPGVSQITSAAPPPLSDRCPEFFPQKLFRIVTDAETSGLSHIVSFAEPTGIKFHNFKLFAEDVLPKYFKHNKLASLKRQLHNYGFEMVGNVYVHEYFQRGRPDLLNRIRRKTNSQDSRVDTAAAEEEEEDYNLDEAFLDSEFG